MARHALAGRAPQLPRIVAFLPERGWTRGEADPAEADGTETPFEGPQEVIKWPWGGLDDFLSGVPGVEGPWVADTDVGQAWERHRWRSVWAELLAVSKNGTHFGPELIERSAVVSSLG